MVTSQIKYRDGSALDFFLKNDDTPPFLCDGCRHNQSTFECLILGIFWVNSETTRSRHRINAIGCSENDLRLRA